MKIAYLLMLIFALTSCGGSSGGGADTDENNAEEESIPDRNSVFGLWELAISTDCSEIYNFSNDNSLRIITNQPLGTFDYELLGSETERDRLEIIGLSDAIGTSCPNEPADTAQFTDLIDSDFVYIEYDGDSMSWYSLPSTGNKLATLSYVPDSFTPIETEGYSLSLVSLEPGTAEAGVFTPFSVTFDYEVPRESRIFIGFSETFRNGWSRQGNIVIGEEATANEPIAGRITLNGEAVPFRWTDFSGFHVYAIIFDLPLADREIVYLNRYLIQVNE